MAEKNLYVIAGNKQRRKEEKGEEIGK